MPQRTPEQRFLDTLTTLEGRPLTLQEAKAIGHLPDDQPECPACGTRRRE